MDEGVAGSRAFEVTEREESSEALVDRLGLVDQSFTKKLLHVGPGSCWGGFVQGTHEIAVVVLVLKRLLWGCFCHSGTATTPAELEESAAAAFLQTTSKEDDAPVFSLTFVLNY